MSAKRSEQPYYDVMVRDFGSGPCLATVGAGATIVLTAFAGNRGGKCHIGACDDHGTLTPEAGEEVLRDVAELWNARAARLRADRDAAGATT
jgi:hypothetical protein